MRHFSKMTADEFVETLKAEEIKREREKHKAKKSGVKPSKKRLKRRNR